MTDNKRRLTVEKIGGTSMADTDAVLNNVLLKSGDQGQGLYNRVIVVSAYAGVTNLLLEHKKTGEPGVYSTFASAESDWSWGDALNHVGERMREINRGIFHDNADRKTADSFVRERLEGVRSCLIDLQRLCSYGHFRLIEHLATVREMLSALGEAHSAHNTVLLLRQRGVNATFVDLTGWRDDAQPSLDERIEAGLNSVNLESELPIVTGYAHCRGGLMGRFERGYTEVTLSRIAVMLGADEAIIHKEFHLSSADPKIVGEKRVRKIGLTNYDVADQLSNMGMEAIHPRAAKGLRQSEISLRVKNTFDPEDPGTVFRDDHNSAKPGAEIITGRRNVMALEFFDQDMVGVKGYDAAILKALARHNVTIVSKSSNANSITHYLAGSLKAVKRVVSDLESLYPTSEISVRKVSIVSTIGADLNKPCLTATAAAALANADIIVLGLHQPMRNVDIQFVIDERDYERAVIALHEALIETPADASRAGNADAKKAA